MGVKSNNVIFNAIAFGNKYTNYTNFTDHFDGSEIDTMVWDLINPANGTISISDSEMSISITNASSQSILGIMSKNKFPVGSRFTVMLRHISGQHACYVGMFESPPNTIGAHGSTIKGISYYGRAGMVEDTVGSYYDESGSSGYTFISGVNNTTSYYKIEMYRESPTSTKFYLNDSIIHTSTALFENDYYLFIGVDGHTKPDTLIVDYINIQTP